MLPTTQFDYRKGQGTCGAHCVSDALQHALKSGQEAKIVKIDFTPAFDRVSHQRILYKLCSVGIEDSMLSVVSCFRSNRSQHVILDDCLSNLIAVVSEVILGNVMAHTALPVPCVAVLW